MLVLAGCQGPGTPGGSGRTDAGASADGGSDAGPTQDGAPDGGADAGCTTAQTAACSCPTGAAGTQLCVGGIFGPCECGTDGGDMITADAGTMLAPDAGSGGLGAFNVNPDTVTVSGISAGAFMSVQLLVAYSASIHGAAIVAGGPYDCYQGNYNDLSLAECAEGIGIANDASKFVSYTNAQASMNTIDPVSNIAGKPIYMFSGTKDLVINQSVMNALQSYLLNFTSSSSITYNNSTAADHAWISPDATNACDFLGPPYLNNCSIDMAQVFLTLFYGTLAPRSASPQGTYVQFNQNAYCPNGSCSSISMDSTAWVYVPAGCAAGDACKLVVVLHGCSSNQEDIGTALIKQSGVNEWADTNDIVVLYPQALNSAQTDCWDFTGYTGANYDLKSAPQMTAIMAMVHQITSG